MKLTAKQREALEALLFDRMSTTDIQAVMLEKFGLSVSHQVISYHRGRLSPELQAGDLEAVQSGAAAFPLLVTSLSTEIAALHDAAVTKEGKLSTAPGAAFSLMVAGQLRRELRELQTGAYDRLFKRQQHEDRLQIERERLALEKARDAREAERHELDMVAARRELELLKMEDEAADFSVGKSASVDSEDFKNDKR